MKTLEERILYSSNWTTNRREVVAFCHDLSERMREKVTVELNLDKAIADREVELFD